jgi:hypothetical protein
MIRHRYFYIENGQRKEELRDGKWLPVSEVQQAHGPLIIRDQLGEGVKGVWNPATDKRYDSRSRYMRDTKAAGCEVVGSDNAHRTVPKAKVHEPLHQTIERLNQQKGWNL